jgi:hypothetical protein
LRDEVSAVEKEIGVAPVKPDTRGELNKM